MRRYVWWTPAARRAIEALTAGDRERFDYIIDFLSLSPFPEPGSTLIRTSRLYGEDLLTFFNNHFPYLVYYRIEDDDVYIELVLRAFVS